MIRTAAERRVEEKNNHLGGNGHLVVRHLLLSPEEMLNKGRVFAHSTLEPGASIGYHIHTGDCEIYYIVSGHGEINDNCEIRSVKAGDVTITPDGHSHGLKNTGEEPLHFIALILYA